MKTKTVNKETLDKLIRLERKYAQTGDVDILDARTVVARMVSVEAFGEDDWWLAFSDFVRSIVGVRPLIKNATNRTVYDALQIVGIEIKEATP